jgi:hypothetical protein
MMTSDDLTSVEVEEPALLIRTNQLYEPGISAPELYDDGSL